MISGDVISSISAIRNYMWAFVHVRITCLGHPLTQCEDHCIWIISSGMPKKCTVYLFYFEVAKSDLLISRTTSLS